MGIEMNPDENYIRKNCNAEMFAMATAISKSSF